MMMFKSKCDLLSESINVYILNNFRSGQNFDISAMRLATYEEDAIYTNMGIYNGKWCVLDDQGYTQSFFELPLQKQCGILDYIIFTIPALKAQEQFKNA